MAGEGGGAKNYNATAYLVRYPAMASKAWYKATAMPRLFAKFAISPTTSSTATIVVPPATTTTMTTASVDETSGAGGRNLSNGRWGGGRSVEVWTTTCIVTNFGMSNGRSGRDYDEVGGVSCVSSSFEPDTDSDDIVARRRRRPPLPECNMLINPSNANLTGPHAFPYFPRGGPQPKYIPSKQAHHIMGYVSQWGGMDVGYGMLFASQTVDGLVHMYGGGMMRAECAYVARSRRRRCPRRDGDIRPPRHHRAVDEEDDDDERCPVGTAVMTSPGGYELRRHFDAIIHTTPPFYDHPPSSPSPPSSASTGGYDENENDDIEDDLESKRARSRTLLGSCYRESFALAFGGGLDDDDDISSNRSTDKERECDVVGWLRRSITRFLLARSRRRPGTDDRILSAHVDDESPRRECRRVAVPLLGAGCRAFPKDVALDVAAHEAASWLLSSSREMVIEEDKDGNERGKYDTVAFGLLDEEDAMDLSARLRGLMSDR